MRAVHFQLFFFMRAVHFPSCALSISSFCESNALSISSVFDKRAVHFRCPLPILSVKRAVHSCRRAVRMPTSPFFAAPSAQPSSMHQGRSCAGGQRSARTDVTLDLLKQHSGMVRDPQPSTPASAWRTLGRSNTSYAECGGPSRWHQQRCGETVQQYASIFQG